MEEVNYQFLGAAGAASELMFYALNNEKGNNDGNSKN